MTLYVIILCYMIIWSYFLCTLRVVVSILVPTLYDWCHYMMPSRSHYMMLHYFPYISDSSSQLRITSVLWLTVPLNAITWCYLAFPPSFTFASVSYYVHIIIYSGSQWHYKVLFYIPSYLQIWFQYHITYVLWLTVSLNGIIDVKIISQLTSQLSSVLYYLLLMISSFSKCYLNLSAPFRFVYFWYTPLYLPSTSYTLVFMTCIAFKWYYTMLSYVSCTNLSSASYYVVLT